MSGLQDTFKTPCPISPVKPDCAAYSLELALVHLLKSFSLIKHPPPLSLTWNLQIFAPSRNTSLVGCQHLSLQDLHPWLILSRANGGSIPASTHSHWLALLCYSMQTVPYQLQLWKCDFCYPFLIQQLFIEELLLTLKINDA